MAASVLLTFAAVIRIVGNYVLTHFSQMLRSSIETRLLETYPRKPFEFCLNRHSSDLSKTFLSEVDQAITNIFEPVGD